MATCWSLRSLFFPLHKCMPLFSSFVPDCCMIRLLYCSADGPKPYSFYCVWTPCSVSQTLLSFTFPLFRHKDYCTMCPIVLCSINTGPCTLWSTISFWLCSSLRTTPTAASSRKPMQVLMMGQYWYPVSDFVIRFVTGLENARWL